MFNESPFLMVILAWWAIVAIVVALGYFHYKRRQLQSKEIMAAIEKGIEVPFPPQRKTDRFTQGVFWTVVGVALLGALAVSTKLWEATSWALIPISIGLAALLASWRNAVPTSD